MKATQRVGTMALAAVAVLTVAVAPAAARRNHTVHQKSELENTGMDDNASGLASLQVKNGSDGRFDLQVKKLDREATYEVLVNGVHIGAITTSRGGSGRIRFRSRPHSSKDLLLGFDPRGATVVVRSADGTDVLQVTMTDDTPAGGSTVVCCVPDDSHAECEDRTADECAAQGGTVSTATSCLPNPCADVPPTPGTEVICCTPDDSGPECEDRSAAECAAEGGVVVEATSCAPNPCAPTIPAAELIQCCIPDDSGFECEDRTSEQCAAQGGSDMGAGTCTPDPCASLGTPPTGDDNGGGNGQGGGADDPPGHN
jgi:hypothetical protein